MKFLPVVYSYVNRPFPLRLLRPFATPVHHVCQLYVLLRQFDGALVIHWFSMTLTYFQASNRMTIIARLNHAGYIQSVLVLSSDGSLILILE